MEQNETWLLLGIAMLVFIASRNNDVEIPPNEPIKVPLPDWLQEKTS